MARKRRRGGIFLERIQDPGKDLFAYLFMMVMVFSFMLLVTLGEKAPDLAGQDGPDQNEVESARKVVKNVPAYLGGDVWTGGLVLLPNARRARVVALGLEDRDGVLARLHQRVRAGLETEGLVGRDGRPLLPHVTIGRMRVPGPVQPTTECERLKFGLESVCLYESELRREGAVYTRLEQVDLQRAHGQEKA